MKSVKRIFIALLLSCILLISVQVKDVKMQKEEIEQAQMPVEKVSTEEIISGFNANKENFEIVKDYMLTKDDDFYLNANNYFIKVQDKNVKAALKAIFTQLKYDVIRNCDFRIRFDCSGRGCENGVAYLKDPNNSWHNETELEDHWYRFYNRHDATYAVGTFPLDVEIKVFVVSFAAFYLILTIINIIMQKLKKAKEATATPTE